ncbi:MAG TPA: GGDEF domain-containing protein, partial [Acidimicrobiales bacterium]|nr:GGDEF domain-containing protein [Acidimicrobiales bacterium]
MPPALVLPPPGELAGDSVGRAAASLVAAVLSTLHEGGPFDEKLVDAAEEFSLTTGTPLDAIAYISRLRRHLLRLESVPRELTDDVIDAVLHAVVARSLAELQDQALTDPLTGLGNRRALDRDFEAESARAARTERPLTVMVIDVDGLKQLNDSRGHAAGDE